MENNNVEEVHENNDNAMVAEEEHEEEVLELKEEILELEEEVKELKNERMTARRRATKAEKEADARVEEVEEKLENAEKKSQLYFRKMRTAQDTLNGVKEDVLETLELVGLDLSQIHRRLGISGRRIKNKFEQNDNEVPREFNEGDDE